MNIQTEISLRPRLSLSYGRPSNPTRRMPRAATLSGKELQQVVADMLG